VSGTIGPASREEVFTLTDNEPSARYVGGGPPAVPDRPDALRHRALMVRSMAGAMTALALATSACSTHHPKETLPATHTQQASHTSASAIAQSYTRYWAVLPQAEHATGEATRRHMLAPYLAEPLLTRVLAHIDKLHAKSATTAGYIVVHIQRVQVIRSQATILDCQDSTHAITKNVKTGRIAKKGILHDPVEALLVHGPDGRWRIGGFRILKSC
jgi:hypothetical protein